MKLEVYFDYACPYCLRGHAVLMELLPRYPALEVEWRPCEAHPRPDRYGYHSDLCARGMYIAAEHGVDLASYHDRMYEAAATGGRNIEDPQVVAAAVEALLEPALLLQALEKGAYREELEENNRIAWQRYGFAAVPSLVCGERQLRSVENVGLTKPMLLAFLKSVAAG